MPTNLHTHDLVLRLKNARAEKGLTLQEIFDKIEEIGLHVGFTSIKKVFSDGSENFGFRYHDTLEPIEKILLKQYPDNGDTETAVLKADLAVKEELIEKLERMIGENQTEYRRRIEFLTGQIDKKDERIDRLMTRVDGVLESNKELTKQLQRLIEKM